MNNSQFDERLDRFQEQIQANFLQSQERLDRIERLQEQTQMQIDQSQRQLYAVQFEVEKLVNKVDNVIPRNEVLNEILLEMRENQELYQQRFEENQRTTNAALEQLTAILFRLIQNDN